MKTMFAVVLMTFALGVASAAAGAPTAQRVAISSGSSVDTFRLVPLQRGQLKKDRGRAIWGAPSQRFQRRGTLLVEIDEVSVTFAGRRGVIEARARVEWTPAGHGFFAGSATWSVLRGTGTYAHAHGGGHGAATWLPGNVVNWRWDGVLTR